MCTKARWDERSKRERDGEEWTKEWELEQVETKTVYNEPAGTMDFTKQTVTGLPTCRRIFVPGPASDHVEITLAHIKQGIDLITDKYIKDNCDSKGNQKASNLSKDEVAGLKSLKKRVADNEILIVPTDKTGKITVTTPERYIASMQPHVANDVIITWKEKESIERRLNGHCIQLG